MSELITWEWRFLLISAMWGMVLSIGYDAIRIFRRVVIHRKVISMAAEDIIFWIICGFVIFHVTFMVNDGIIRSFSLGGFLIGSAMYQYTVSAYIVKYVSKLIIIILKPLKKIYKSIKIFLNRLFKRLKQRKPEKAKVGNSEKKGKPYEKIRDKKGKTTENKKAEEI